MRTGQALAEIRLLCAQGLAGQTLVPTVAEVLRQCIPSAWSGFLFVDEQAQPTALYSDAPELAALYQRYLDDYCNSAKEAAGGVRLQDGMTTGAPVENTARLGKRFLDSEYFNEIFVPMKVRHGLAAPVRAPGGGALMLFRAPKERAFSDADEAALAQVTQYLCHGLSAPVAPVDAWGADGEEALLVIDTQGHIQHYSARAAQLLYLLASDSSSTARMLHDETVTRLLAAMAAALRDPQAPLPQHTVTNNWGRFCLRAHWLEPCDGDGQLIVVSIALQLPLPVSLLRTLRPLPLSPRHKELCLHLVRGLSYGEAAKAMHLRPSTASDYAKEIYARLGVRGREGLLLRLLTRPP